MALVGIFADDPITDEDHPAPKKDRNGERRKSMDDANPHQTLGNEDCPIYKASQTDRQYSDKTHPQRFITKAENSIDPVLE